MATPERQILVCQSFRVAGDKKGICHKNTDGFLQYLEEEILDRGLDCPGHLGHRASIPLG